MTADSLFKRLLKERLPAVVVEGADIYLDFGTASCRFDYGVFVDMKRDVASVYSWSENEWKTMRREIHDEDAVVRCLLKIAERVVSSKPI